MISVIVAKFQYPDTFVPGALVGLISVFEWGSVMLMYVLQIKDRADKMERWPRQAVLVLAILITNGILNLANFVAFQKTIQSDKYFKLWRAIKRHRFFLVIVRTLALIVSFRFQNLLFSRYFGFSLFKVKLESVDKLNRFNVLLILSIVFFNLPVIATAALTATYDSNKS